MNSTEGWFSSPGYPSPYPVHQNCEWNIYIKPDHYLNVTISNVDIIPSSKCQSNYLRPRDSKFKYSKRLCGYYHRINYIVNKSNALTKFRFRTGEFNEERGTGFLLHYQQVKRSSLNSEQLNTVTIDNSRLHRTNRVWSTS